MALACSLAGQRTAMNALSSATRRSVVLIPTFNASSAPSSSSTPARSSQCLCLPSRRHLHSSPILSRPSSYSQLGHEPFISQQPRRRPRRLYHSSSHPQPSATSETFTEEQRAILSAAVSHIPTHGFSAHTLTLGARDAGYLDASLQLFPRGGEAELVLYWLASRRDELRRMVESGEIFGEKVDGTEPEQAQRRPEPYLQQKVSRLIIERLRMNEGVIGHWQDALAIMSLPSNIPPSLCELYALSSDILHLAGDTTIDASWYAKRLSVATVYASAEVVMTEDASEGFANTAEFVERRLRDADTFVETLGDVKKYLGYVAGSVVAAGRSFGMKV